MKQVQACLLTETKKPFQVRTVDLDETPGPREVRVKMLAVGACRSDHSVMTGATKHKLPVILGHEGSGVIVEVGSHVKWKVEDHVILNWAPSCGDRCEPCLKGRPSLCETYEEQMNAGAMMSGKTRVSLEGQTVYRYSGLGCLSDEIVVDEDCCVPVDKKVPPQVAAVIGCAVTTGISATLRSVKISPGDRIAIFGMGGVGLSVLLGAKLSGAGQIIAIDTALKKRDLCLQLGATDFLLAHDKTVSEVLKLTKNCGVDFAFDAIGNASVQQQSLDVLCRGGTSVLLGLTPMGTRIDFKTDEVVRRGLRVIGSYYGDSMATRDFRLYSELYLKRRLDLEGLISQTYFGLEKANLAYEAMLSGEAGRAVILF